MIKNFVASVVNQALKHLPRRSRLIVSFLIRFRRFPNVIKPETFNEKILWRKLYEHDESLIEAVDKVTARDVVSRMVGPEFLVPMQGVFDSWRDVPFNDLKYPCVIKTSSGSGAVRVLRAHSDDCIKECLSYFRALPTVSYSENFGEWAYAFVQPRIIVEDMLSEDGMSVPNDYKFYVYEGQVRFFHIDVDRFKNHRRIFFGHDLRLIDVEFNFPIPAAIPPLPKKIDEMIQLAERLGSPWNFVRVDLYEVKSKIYFGEFTFYPEAGMGRFLPSSWDLEFGKFWPIPSSAWND